MPKILLVEDDNNLREIFEMRLQAEGYKTVTAGDGEEALDIAVKEKPDLIIADIMMPKLSGFEMLETLRAAPEMANVKVIMMTALGQAEDRARGEKLGVVKYLVKSQVTLEDFVRVVREVLPPSPNAAGPSQPPTSTVQPDASVTSNNQESEGPMQEDTQPTSPASGDTGAAGTNPISGDAADSSTAGSDAMSTDDQQKVVSDQENAFGGGGASMPSEPAAGGDSTGAAPSGDTGATDTSAPAMPSTSEPTADGGEATPGSDSSAGTPGAV